MPALSLHDLARSIKESCISPRGTYPPLPTRWTHSALSHLSRAAVHEWFSADPTPGTHRSAPPWLPPLSPVLHLARQAIAHSPVSASADSPRLLAWIGRRVWPYPVACPDLLDQSIFIDTKDLPERAWAADVSLRSGALAAVIVDGSAFSMSITRRLQLAAAESGGLGLILRPHADLRQLSAAHTRWLVTPAPSLVSPRWNLELLRLKGGKLPDVTTWTLELNHETGTLDLVSDAAHRSVATPEIARTVTA
ncbi:MAG: hypothetical protein KF678_00355 [Phycisphaeraceae bacterium]|nr:hypothetical protein [Phycisphaeraceae bacterium]